MLHDLRYALRSLRKSPGFTAIAVVCVALGVGANTAIFSLLDAVMLRTLPVPDPERLVVLQNLDASGRAGRGGSSFSYPLFAHLRKQSAEAADLFAYGGVDLNLSAGDVTDAPAGLLVSDNYFAVLGVQPAIGRFFTASDGAVAVLGERYWHSRFQANQAILGEALLLNGVPFTVIGIAPRRFFGTEVGRSPDVFVPLALRDDISPSGPRLAQPNSFWLRAMARLRPGVTTPQATLHLGSAYDQYVKDVAATLQPGLRRYLQQRRIALASGARGAFGISDQFGAPLLILMAVVCLVLLIACSNVASLVLTRTRARQHDTAIRLALGARRVRIVRQLSCESAVLAAAGGTAGLFLGLWSANVLTTFLMDRVLDVALDARIFGFTLAMSAVTALLFGVMPALRATGSDLTPAFKSGASSVAGDRGRLGRVLVPAQVALSLLLLIGAGLFIRTLSNLRTMDPGFRGDRVLLATFNPGLSRYTPERTRTFYNELIDRAAALPGVDAVSLADAPLLRGTYIDGISINGTNVETSLKIVGPRFFETMGIPFRAGRDFSMADTAASPRVAIINETMARRYFNGEDPIGQRVGVDGSSGVEIVGVIADTKYRNLRDAIPNTVYLAMPQARVVSTERTLHVRTAEDPAGLIPAMREQVRALDSRLPVKIVPFSAVIAVNLEQERLIATLCGFFAGLAVLLTAIGLYGVIAFTVQRRIREIGIRMSLGARRAEVVWMVLRDSLTLLLLGVALGLPLSLWASRLVANQLFGVSPADPLTIAGATGVLTAVATLGGYLPARRAARVDPVVALRYE